ncbi:hypothetical protein LXL04_014708 [Taraxacum kok-saghyz]
MVDEHKHMPMKRGRNGVYEYKRLKGWDPSQAVETLKGKSHETEWCIPVFGFWGAPNCTVQSNKQTLFDIEIVKEYFDGLSPDRQIKFVIELVVGANSIDHAP